MFTANRIAAGEVVERPVSIVKELIENSIDAGATAVSVEIQEGGISSIRISDNGKGMDFDDALMAFERHATSKIQKAEDLDSVETLGFRGEALCSIAAVAQVDLFSHIPNAPMGVHVRMAGGMVEAHEPSGCPDGTTIQVDNLFFNTPARLKFLKKPSSEAGAIGDCLARMILARPDISFKFINNDKAIYHSMGDGELFNAMYCVYGRELIAHVKPVEYQADELIITGYVSTSEGSRPNRTYQSFFVNERYVQSSLLSAALQEAFGTRLMGGRFPLCALNINLPHHEVDVNIHPNKLTIRFRNETEISDVMRQSIEKAIADQRVIQWPIKSKQAEATVTEPLYHSRLSKENDEQIMAEQEPPKINRILQSDAAMPEREILKDEIPVVVKNISLENNQSDFEEENLQNQSVPTFYVPDERPSVLYARESSAARELGQETFLPKQSEVIVVGQAFSTYIIVQQGDSLYVIDQHAAHERMLFDRVREQAKKIEAQQLMGAIDIDLTPVQMVQLDENKGLLQSMGFAWQEVDANSIYLQSVPHMFGKSSSIDFLSDVLDAFADMRAASPVELKKDMLAQFACKHAIKGAQSLTVKEIEALLDQFEQIQEYHCPHGRPIILRVSRKDIEKAFGRIVS